MSIPSDTKLVSPTLPSCGGLMNKNFIYRTSKQTDVRLTWVKAKAANARQPSSIEKQV